MDKKVIWIIMFVVGLIMILGASEFSRWIGNENSYYIAGTILSIFSGISILLEIYIKRDR